jgi:cell wall-associated NlpC family hydrolase
MALRNQLFFIIFTPVFVSACGTLPSGRDPSAATPRAPVGNSVATIAAPAGRAIAPSRDSDMLFYALAAAGVDYRRGGKSYQRGFDCSGLVAFVYREAYSLALPHNTQAQSELGEAINLSQLQSGDLVFFNTQRKPFSHVGIYIGEGRFVHAPKEGAVVRTENMRARYWTTRFDGARRIVPMVVTADYPALPKKPVVTHP